MYQKVNIKKNLVKKKIKKNHKKQIQLICLINNLELCILTFELILIFKIYMLKEINKCYKEF